MKKENKIKPVEPKTLTEMPTNEAEFIRSCDVVTMLNISNSTLKNLRQTHAIPFYRIGCTFLYRREEILEYIERNYASK